MPATREQAQRGAARTNAAAARLVAIRRDHVALLLVMYPGYKAEAVAEELQCSPSTIRRDWRALKRRGRDG